MRTTTSFVLAVVAWICHGQHYCQAFTSPTTTTVTTNVHTYRMLPVTGLIVGGGHSLDSIHRLTPTVLYYREIDDDDDDRALLRVQTRAPPGFNVQESARTNRVLLGGRGSTRSTAMNRSLIQALLLNQALILALATVTCALILLFTQGFGAFSNLNEILHWTSSVTDSNAAADKSILDFTVTANNVAWGIGGALPMMVYNNWIDQSDRRIFANINFSTIVMVMTLFGRRQAPPDEFRPPPLKGVKLPETKPLEVLMQSFALSAMTGFCEESVFRRQVPALLTQFLGNQGLGLISVFFLQAVIFGLGHSQPKVPLAENAVVVGLQTLNGLAFGLIYLLSGGDLVAAIIAHAAYDFVTFFKTWSDANAQLEYAERMALKPLPKEDEARVQTILRSSRSSELLRKDPRLYNTLKRLFYTFDFDKNESLSLSEVRKGIAYMVMEKAGTPPPPSEVDFLFTDTLQSGQGEVTKNTLSNVIAESNRMTFPDFLRMYTMMMDSGNKADKSKTAKQAKALA